jgi:DNA-binding NtrC family response regulator
MVVLAPGREIQAADIPRPIREGARFLPVHVSPALRAAEAAEGREVEFIVRNLVELKLQVEELRRRVDEERSERESWIGEVRSAAGFAGEAHGGVASGGSYPSLPAALEPGDVPPEPNVITLKPGMTMADIERAAIEAALKETRGNRRQAAELLGIGERTLYRKLREYQLPESSVLLD